MSGGLRSRIVDHIELKPSEILDHPSQWRAHPKRQIEFVRKILGAIGIVDELLIYKSKRFDGQWVSIDGHLRKSLDSDQIWPCAVLDVTDEEADLILATFDPSSEMADSDKAMLKALLDQIDFSEELRELEEEVAKMYRLARPNSDDKLEEVPTELEGVLALKPDMRFDSNEPFGIPMLREDRLAEIPEGLETWAGDRVVTEVGQNPYLLIYGQACTKLDFKNTVLSFYVDDAVFEPIWISIEKYTARFLNAGFKAVVSINFSLWPEQAEAVHIYQTYRSRWTARYFQEAGLNLIPDVNWASSRNYHFCFSGIPKGAPAISIQVQTFNRRNIKEVKGGILKAIETIEPKSVLFYASKSGRELIDEMKLEIPITVLETRLDVRREYINETTKKGVLV